MPADYSILNMKNSQSVTKTAIPMVASHQGIPNVRGRTAAKNSREMNQGMVRAN